MTEQGKPLSRRERRALEARQSGGDIEPTEAIADATGEATLTSPDGTPLNRRDRRRLERAAHPMETWTAEEEMIATGQLPAMTPERIVEQEAMARQKAEQAAAEAEAEAADAAAAATVFGSADGVDGDEPHANLSHSEDQADVAPAEAPARPSIFGRAVGAELPHQADGADDVAPEVAPEADAEPEPEPDRQHDAPEPVAESVPRPEPVFEQPVESHADAVAEPATAVDAEPADISDVPAAPFFASASDPDPVADLLDESTPAAEPEPYDPTQTPEAFRGMFPPGSLQARAFAAQQRVEQAERVSSQTYDGGSDAAEEFRRLTAMAMAGIEGSSATHAKAPVPEEVMDVETPTSDFTLDEVDASASQSAPHHATFDQVIAPHSGEHPLVERTIDPSADIPMTPQTGSNPVVAPSIWDSHPLSQSHTTAREINDAPSQAIPRPDFSQLAPAPSPAAPAPFTADAYTSMDAPLTTGSIEVARRKVPELHPAGGARHFRWAHLAVLGAIAFVLGVLVWNLIGQTP